MQKLINVLGVAGFVVAALNTAIITYAVMRGPQLVEENLDKIQATIMRKLNSALTDSVTEAMPGQVKELMPALPTETGPALPF